MHDILLPYDLILRKTLHHTCKLMKIYVINLERSKDRLEHITAVFHECGLDFERVSAVDGQTLTEEAFRHLTSARNWPLELTRSEVGCFLSHRQCLRLIAEGDDAYGAVFEDDIILSPNAPLFLRDWSWIPAGTDLVKMDTAEINCVTGRVSARLTAGYCLAPLIGKHYCAGGYIVSRFCARRLYDLTEYATAPIDEIYFNPDCHILQMLNVQQMIPAPVIQAGLISTIRTAEKKIHQSSRLPPAQKIRREIRRINRKYLQNIRLLVLSRGRWGKIAFK
jgi:glycosyl transferase family 25